MRIELTFMQVERTRTRERERERANDLPNSICFTVPS